MHLSLWLVFFFLLISPVNSAAADHPGSSNDFLGNQYLVTGKDFCPKMCLTAGQRFLITNTASEERYELTIAEESHEIAGGRLVKRYKNRLEYTTVSDLQAAIGQTVVLELAATEQEREELRANSGYWSTLWKRLTDQLERQAEKLHQQEEMARAAKEAARQRAYEQKIKQAQWYTSGFMSKGQFITLTNEVMDALDNVESTIRNDSIIEARKAVTKLDASLKKYDRYKNEGKWPEGAQKDIFVALTGANMMYSFCMSMATITSYVSKEGFSDAEKEAEQARKYFRAYLRQKPSAKHGP